MQLRRLATWLPVLAWMSVIFYLSAQSRPLEKTPSTALSYVAHFTEYAVLAFLLFWAQLFGNGWKGNLRVALALSLVVSALFAASDEYHQSFVPGRDASFLDFLTDCFGAAVALTVTGRWAGWFLWRRGRYPQKALPADPKRDPP
jgi:VanZ family protein